MANETTASRQSSSFLPIHTAMVSLLADASNAPSPRPRRCGRARHPSAHRGQPHFSVCFHAAAPGAPSSQLAGVWWARLLQTPSDVQAMRSSRQWQEHAVPACRRDPVTQPELLQHVLWVRGIDWRIPRKVGRPPASSHNYICPLQSAARFTVRKVQPQPLAVRHTAHLHTLLVCRRLRNASCKRYQTMQASSTRTLLRATSRNIRREPMR